MNNDTINMLVGRAILAREQSYCPYSEFAVGAALLTDHGAVYTGANIESASFSPTVCAERVAFFSAVHAGERSFAAIAIVGGKKDDIVSSFTPPCGVCRQVMCEFCGEDFEIILFDGRQTRVYTLSELFPESFGFDKLN